MWSRYAQRPSPASTNRVGGAGDHLPERALGRLVSSPSQSVSQAPSWGPSEPCGYMGDSASASDGNGFASPTRWTDFAGDVADPMIWLLTASADLAVALLVARMIGLRLAPWTTSTSSTTVAIWGHCRTH